MADREGAPSLNDFNGIDGITPQFAAIERKGEIRDGANPQNTGDLLHLLDPPDPGKQNAAPAGPRNGAQSRKEASELQAELYPDLLHLLEPSPLDRPIGVTRFDDVAARSQQRDRVSLRDFAESIRRTRAAAKAELPLCKLATFGDVPTPRRSLRHDANLVAIDGIEGDYDAGVVSVDDARARLEAAGLAAVIFTTPSHRPDAPRWRVLCPTSEPMTRDDRAALAERLNAALGGILARESFTASQAFYFGAVGEATHHRVELVEGRAIDRATYIRATAAPSPSPERVAPVDDDDDLFDLMWPEPDWERVRAALAAISADDRDDWLRVGMALHAAGRGNAEAFAMWSDWSQRSDKFNARDQRRTWDSFNLGRTNRVEIGSLFDLAKRHGWEAKAPAAPATPSRLRFLSPGDCEATPSRGYVIKGIVAPGDVGCIFGAPGAGKSLISPHLGYAVAQGREAFGMRTKAGRVFYVAAEDPHGMRGRVTALKLRHGDADEFRLVEGVSDLLSDESPDLAALVAAVEGERPRLVFIDTLAMAFPGLEENSAEAMGRVVAVARQLAQHGAAVILVHHDTKAEGKTPRGHSVLNGALDFAIYVSRDEHGVVSGRLTKNRNGGCERDMAFLIDTRELGIDEDDDPITAALVDELPVRPVKRSQKVSPSAKAAFEVLREKEAQQPDSPDNDPLSAYGVSEESWRKACISGRWVSAAEDSANRTRAFRRAARELADKGWTITIDGYVRSQNPRFSNDLYAMEGLFDD